MRSIVYSIAFRYGILMTYTRRYRTARRRGRGRSGYTKRRNIWINTQNDSVDAVAHNVISPLPDSALDPGARVGATVVRVIGSFNWVTIGNNDVDFMTVGMAVSEIQTAAPSTLNPRTDSNNVDWMYWNKVNDPLGTTVINAATGVVQRTLNFDIKSSRVIPVPNMTLNWFFEYSASGQGALSPLLGWHYWSRTLLKLA